MKTCLVTGGAGFIGSHLTAALVERGLEVRVLDDLSSGHRANLAAVADRITFIAGSICDPAVVARAVASVDVVYHLAARVSVPESVANPTQTVNVNVGGTLTLLEAARRAGVSRVVLAATCAAYGPTPRLPSRETDPVQPVSPYAATKLMTEHLAQVYTATMGLPVVALRYFNVYGPRQDPHGAYAAVIPRFALALAAGATPTLFGDGHQTRDFIHVRDVVSANLLAATTPNAAGQVFNIGSGTQLSLRELVAQLAAALGVPPRFVLAPARDGDVLHSVADISRARAVLGFAPAVTFNDGARETALYYAAHTPAAAAEQE